MHRLDLDLERGKHVSIIGPHKGHVTLVNQQGERSSIGSMPEGAVPENMLWTHPSHCPGREQPEDPSSIKSEGLGCAHDGPSSPCGERVCLQLSPKGI